MKNVSDISFKVLNQFLFGAFASKIKLLRLKKSSRSPFMYLCFCVGNLTIIPGPLSRHPSSLLNPHLIQFDFPAALFVLQVKENRSSFDPFIEFIEYVSSLSSLWHLSSFCFSHDVLYIVLFCYFVVCCFVIRQDSC